MTARLLILVVMAAGLAVYWAQRAAAPPSVVSRGPVYAAPPEGTSMANTSTMKQSLMERELPGEDPPTPAEIDVRVEVDTSSGKNRLVYYLSESQGYYVETFALEFWYVTGPDMDLIDAPIRFVQRVNDYVEVNKELSGCIEVTPGELRPVGGDIGNSDNWYVELLWYHRARVQNPDPLPPIIIMNKCRKTD